MKYLALLTLAALCLTGCSVSPSERKAWSVFGRKAAGDAEAIALLKLAQ